MYQRKDGPTYNEIKMLESKVIELIKERRLLETFGVDINMQLELFAEEQRLAELIYTNDPIG